MFGDSENLNVLDVEIETLRSIYLDELNVECDESGAICTVSMQLYPATADNVEEQYVRLCLLFKVPPEYPDSIPEIHVHNPRGLLDDQVDRIKENLLSIAENRKGSSMLFELIDAAKSKLTDENRPREDCAICLYGFVDGDVFMKTECYHYFHSHCLSRYMQCKLRELQEEQKTGPTNTDKSHSTEKKVPCPVCRVPISFDYDGKEFPEPVAVSSAAVDFDSSFVSQRNRMEKLFKKQLEQGGIIDVEAESKKYLLEISNVPDDPVEQQETVHSSSTATDWNADSLSAASTRYRTSPNPVPSNSGPAESPAKSRKPWYNKRLDRDRVQQRPSGRANAPAAGEYRQNESRRNRSDPDDCSSPKEDRKPMEDGGKYQRGPRFNGYRNDNRAYPRNHGYRNGPQNFKPPFNRRTYRENANPGDDSSHNGRTNNGDFSSQSEKERHSPRGHRNVDKYDHVLNNSGGRNGRSGAYRMSSQDPNHGDFDGVDSCVNNSSDGRSSGRSGSHRMSSHDTNRRDRDGVDSRRNNYNGRGGRSGKFRERMPPSQDFNYRDFREGGDLHMDSVHAAPFESESTANPVETNDTKDYQEKQSYRQYDRRNRFGPKHQHSLGKGNSDRYPSREGKPTESARASENSDGDGRREAHGQDKGNYQNNESWDNRREAHGQDKGNYQNNESWDNRRKRNPNWQPRRYNNNSNNNYRPRNNFRNDSCLENETGKHSVPRSVSNRSTPSAEELPKPCRNSDGPEREPDKHYHNHHQTTESLEVKEIPGATAKYDDGFVSSADDTNLFVRQIDYDDEATKNCSSNAQQRSLPGFANPLKKVVYGLPSVNPPPGFHRS